LAVTTASDRANMTAWQRRRRAAISAGTWQPRLRDAAPARAHLQWMRTLGLSPSGCAEAIGIPYSTVAGVLYPIGGDFRGMVTAETERLILSCDARAILDRLPDGRHLCSVGSRRRVQCLAVAGWSRSYLAARMGVTLQALSAMIRRDRVTARNARTIRGLYDELSMRAGPSARTRRDAAASGWSPCLAWDDDTIDDPAVGPSGVAESTRSTVPQRLVAAQVDDLVRTRCGWDEAAARIGVTGRNLERVLHRVGRPDLVSMLRSDPELRVLPPRVPAAQLT
jgi:hypothetical protein